MRYLITIISVLFLLSCSKNSEKKNYNDTSTLFSLTNPNNTGVDFVNSLKEDKKNNHFINDMFVAGAGVAVGDINNDGLDDIFFSGNQVADRLYLNKGNLKFEDITESSGIGLDKLWSAGVTMIDIDSDGDIDIYVCRSVQNNSQLSGNKLYINNSDLTFKESAGNFGLADRGFSVQATFFDYDKDGLIDMYLVNQPPSQGKRNEDLFSMRGTKKFQYTDRLFKNNGANFFEDVTDKAGVRNVGFGLSASVGDFNNDSWPDLYVTNDFNKPDHLYINQGNGKFKNRVDQSLKHMSNFSMGSDAADYDNDGNIDVMVVDMVAEDHKRNKTTMGGMTIANFWKIVNNGWHYQYMFNTLQRNNGNGTFSELAQLGGVSNTDWSWGPLFADFDNDGWKDLFITNGIKRNQRYTDVNKKITQRLDSLEAQANRKNQNLNDLIDVNEFINMTPEDRIDNYIFKNNGDLTFKNKVQEWGMKLKGLSYGSAYSDLDNDGDIDIIVNNVDDHAFIYQNNSDKTNNYIRIKLKDPLNKTVFQGTKVKLFKRDELWQMSELSNARGYMSKSEDVLHFGLKEIDKIDNIQIQYPNGTTKQLENIQANQTLEIIYNSKDSIISDPNKPQNQEKLFADKTSRYGLNILHQENDFNDYNREVLLPHKMSSFGPGISVGDANGDGLEDFYLGGAKGITGKLFLQTNSESFEYSDQKIFKSDKNSEDIKSVFLDIDNDGDLDLYVVSGGNEFEPGDNELQDRLYLNNGRGIFSKGKLPEMIESGSTVKAIDFDKDGDLDLIVGGRIVPGKYPLPASSYLLENQNGNLIDVTIEKAPQLRNIGLVTDINWTDVNSDGLVDIVLVGEWMPVTVLVQNNENTFKKVIIDGLKDTEGWYYSVNAADIDNDGDQDLIVGNLGLNYKYKASKEAPFEVYSNDFDNNGKLDIVLSYYEDGHSYPVRGRSCSMQQIPTIGQEFPTYASFGDADLSKVYGTDLDSALNYKAYSFASAIIENKGNLVMEVNNLPNLAQTSSINNILIDDFNADGNKDLLVTGNLYNAEIETPRNDAGMGLFLKGDGKGQFEPTSIAESGFFAPHDAKSMEKIKIGNKTVILVGNNKYYMQAIELLR